MDWVTEFKSTIDGAVLADEPARTESSSDFGGVIRRVPQAVVRPATAQDVSRVLKFAAGRSLAVSPRGAGHSQSGQSLSGGIVLDMKSLDKVGQLEEDRLTVTCQAGITWRALLAELAPYHLSPPVLTNNLDVTVGGTLSTAGLGVSTWRNGTQADHCLELEVVTGTGEVLHCSPTANFQLFNAVRGGMGQFGVMTKAKLQLRRHKPRFRSFYLLYEQLGTLLGDLERLMVEERFDYLESWCVPLPMGFKEVSGQRQAFAQWFYPLHATVEVEGDPSQAGEKLEGLKFYKHVHTEDGDIQGFFARLDPLFALWKRAGFWDYAHPWMECILPWETTEFYVGQVLSQMQPQVIAGGHILLWPAQVKATSVPLFMRPKSRLAMGFGILPAVPSRFLPDALPRLQQASLASMMVGGKRYLSGWVDFDADQWKAHYGEEYDRVKSLKAQYDPANILSPDFLKLESTM
ncbi:MAG TPA: FAD-binding protein [Terriglobia bacterium]|nr:FAD-binding protein [Terriglobia bacterium]